jgi:PAS domain S-box-containing protein
MISSVLLFVGTFGFEMFRMLPFTFDGTVKTLKDGVLIVDEHQKLLYSNPALLGLIDQPIQKDLAGETLSNILPDFPFQLLDDKFSSENQEMREVQLLPSRFFDLQISKIHNQKHITISSLIIIKEVTERKRLEEEGKQSRELYTKIFQASPAALVLSRLDNCNFIEVNEMFLKLSGFSREELIGHTSTELNFWKDPSDRDRLVELTKTNDTKRNLELTYRRKDGMLRICTASPQRIDLGNIPCMLSVLEDVTEQIEIEELIKSNEEKFRTLFDHAGDGIYIADMKGTIIDANIKALNRLGFTHDELVGKGFADFIAHDDIPGVVAGLKELWSTGSTFRELTGLSKDGKRIPAEINGQTITISGAKALLISSRDITERKEAERALRNEKERLDVTLNNINEGVIVTDLQGVVVLANISAAVLLDRQKEELPGRRLQDIYRIQDPTTGEETDSAISTTLRTGLVSTTYRVPFKSNAWNMLINESASPIFEGERMVGAVLAFHDVTLEKNLEEEIAKAARLRTIGTLAGGIAHDFNNVLTIIMGNIELTRKSGMSHFDADKWFDDISRALERAKDLSNQLLTFSKGGAPVKKDTALEDLVNETIGEVFDGHDVHRSVKFPHDLGKVNIDDVQVKQALLHIMKNALEAMPQGGLLDVSAVHSYVDGESMFLAPGEYVHVRIKDSGTGIPMSELNHVFEPYYTTKQNHTGMGLAVAYSIVKAHNGHISIESETDKGTTVHIYIPSLKKDHSIAQISDSSMPQKSSLRVLVMDDEELIRDVASEMLAVLGHASDCVYGGQEALEHYANALASGNPYDLVIMDLTIPNGMGGKQAIAELLKIDPKAKVIVSSGYSNDPVMSDYRNHGFTYVMPKPYRMKEFEMAINQTMGYLSEPNIEMTNGKTGAVMERSF